MDCLVRTLGCAHLTLDATAQVNYSHNLNVCIGIR